MIKDIMMNEQIQQIVKQSGGRWNHCDPNMGSSVEFQEKDIEHFVRLIVQECVKSIPLDMDHTEYLTVMRKVKATFRS
jgi:hypothetical protein